MSVVWDGKPKTFHLSAEMAEQVRDKVEMRKRFEEAAGKIAHLNLRRFLRQKGKT